MRQTLRHGYSSRSLTILFPFAILRILLLIKDPSLRVGDVVVPERWSLYQKQHFAKEMENGDHEIPDWAIPNLMGDDCGAGIAGASNCVPGVNTWNYSFIYPTATYAADPTQDGRNATIERPYV
jgi:hypothetical protein